jgi:hypothetical protein
VAKKWESLKATSRSPPRRSGYLEYRTANGLRQLCGQERGFGIKVVLSRLIDHPDLLELLGASIGNRYVNFPELQRYLVSCIVDANHQFSC